MVECCAHNSVVVCSIHTVTTFTLQCSKAGDLVSKTRCAEFDSLAMCKYLGTLIWQEVRLRV